MGNIEITPELLADLKEKAEKATPDIWEIGYHQIDNDCSFSIYSQKTITKRSKKQWYDFRPFICENNNKYNYYNINDGFYIAAANPAVILALIAKIEQLEKEADWLAARLQTICKHEVPDVCAMLDVTKCPFFPGGEILMKDERIKCKWEHTNWRNAAKEAVKSNE